MKPGFHFFRRLACCAMLVLASRAQGTDPSLPAPMVRMDVLMLSMPEEKMLAVLPDLLDKDKIEKAVPELLEAVKRKEITLVGYQFVTTKSGMRAVAETVKEIRYPSGYTQEEAYNNLARNMAAVASSHMILDPTPPTPMETRNMGVTFEVEPTVSDDGKYIDILLAPEHVELIGFLDAKHPGKAGGFVKGEIGVPTSRPLVYTAKDVTSVTLRDGRHVLLGIHKTAAPDNRVEIFILHAEILTLAK